MNNLQTNETQPNKKVFLSYSTGGEEGRFVHNIVEQLYQDLVANYCSVWSFERESVGGIQFQDQYIQAIEDSDAFILFCNSSARNSVYIHEEIKTALELGKPIIQVLLDYDGPHPLLKNQNLTPIRYNDKNQRNRVYLFHHILKAIRIPITKYPGDKFNALNLPWKVYQRDQMYYPICNQESIRLLGSESSQMDIQTEADFSHASIKLRAESEWKTETSIGFEKWYGDERYSIALQNGYVWIRWKGRFWIKSKSYLIKNWQTIRPEKSLELEIQWNEIETVVFVNHEPICQAKTLVNIPLKLRLNADINDYIVIEYLEISNQ